MDDLVGEEICSTGRLVNMLWLNSEKSAILALAFFVFELWLGKQGRLERSNGKGYWGRGVRLST